MEPRRVSVTLTGPKSGTSARTGEPWVDEFRVVLRDGTVRWFHGAARRITPEHVTPAHGSPLQRPASQPCAQAMVELA